MQDEAVDKDRKVVPRWRPLGKTPAAELLPSKQVLKAGIQFDDVLLERALEKWHYERNIESAAEVIDGAAVSGKLQDGEEAARFIFAERNNATEAVKLVAKFVLGSNKDDDLLADHGNLSDVLRRAVCRKQIASLRSRVLNYPLDAFSWLEIGRLQTSLGQLKPARQAVMRALGVAETTALFFVRQVGFFCTKVTRG